MMGRCDKYGVGEKKEVLVVILALSNGQDANDYQRKINQTKQSIADNPFFHNLAYRILVADGEDGTYGSVGALKNQIAIQEEYEGILFLDAGEKLGNLTPMCEEKDFEDLKSALLLNGPDAAGRIIYSKSVFFTAGGFANLPCDEEYEFAIRAADYEADGMTLYLDDGICRTIYEGTLELYAYLLICYQSFLRDRGEFDAAFFRMYREAKNVEAGDLFTEKMEAIAQGDDTFADIIKEAFPILMMIGREECQGTIGTFAEDFARALRQQGKGVVTINSDEDINRYKRLLLKSYAAAVGFQTRAFSTQLRNGTYIGDLMPEKKYTFLFDHPIYLTKELSASVKDVYVLSQDETYTEYINQNISSVARAYHFPPAGKTSCDAFQVPQIYDLCFIGTYNDYRIQERRMEELPENYRRISRLFYNRQKHHPNERAEEALHCVFEDLTYDVMGQQFVDSLYAMGYAVRALMYYYREKTVRTILEAGVTVDVFSESWREAPFANHPCLNIHPAISYEESLNVMAKSKMSLNVMSWHKGGMTERIANAFLNGSVCVTDQTTYLRREYGDKDIMVLFNLENMEDLSLRIKALLIDENHRIAMARKAYEIGRSEHTWDVRARGFLHMMASTADGA